MKIKQHFISRWSFNNRVITDFRKLVSSLSSYVYIGLGDGDERLANAKSVIGVLSLQISNDMDFTIIVINDDDSIAESDMEIIKQWFKVY